MRFINTLKSGNLAEGAGGEVASDTLHSSDFRNHVDISHVQSKRNKRKPNFIAYE